MAAVEEAKQFLLKNNNGDGNVYEHLAECLLKVLAERPGDTLSLFENISAAVKADKLRTNEEGTVEDESVKAGQDAWTKASTALLTPLEEMPADVQDLVDDSNLFEWAGVGFGREETFRLSLSMKKLASEQGDVVSELKLFGKFLGTGADYYVVGGKSAAAEEGADGNDMEGLDGANTMCYFVCNKIGDEWVKLPDVTTAQIVACRKLKKFFSGNLDKKVTGYPPFPGTERNLLRAVIGDISASCSATPAGVFSAEDGVVALNEDGPPERSVEEMADLGSWEHLLAGLNAYGRCTKLPEKEDENGEPIVDESEPEVQEVLRPISGDEEGTWTTRVCPSQGGSQALAVLKSLLFPGAYTVALNQKYVNIYVGYGHRVSSTTYSPPAPGAILGEVSSGGFAEEADVLEDPNPPEEGEGENE